MKRTLFTVSPGEEVTQQMLEEFCHLGIRETTRVDYKQDFPSDLAKHVAAFSNTQGGLILIGVKTDAENTPLTPIAGIRHDKGISERVFQTCVASISPPVIPDVWPVKLEDSKCAVVIRVAESDATPHAVEGRQGIYLRTGNISSPFTRATVEEIQELLRRRQAGERRKQDLIERFRERWEFFQSEYVNECEGKWREPRAPFDLGLEVSRFDLESFPKCLPGLELLSIPSFPRQMVVSREDLLQTIHSFPLIRVSQQENWALGRGHLRSAQESFVQYSGGTFPQFAEINLYGLAGYSELSTEAGRMMEQRIKKEHPDSLESISFDETYTAILGFLISIVGLYGGIGYWGSVDVSLCLSNTAGKFLQRSKLWPSYSSTPCPDHEVMWRVCASVPNLKENLGDFFCQALEYVCSSFGYEQKDLKEAALREFELAQTQHIVRHYLQTNRATRKQVQ